jgi:hypothetical protein
MHKSRLGTAIDIETDDIDYGTTLLLKKPFN